LKFGAFAKFWKIDSINFSWNSAQVWKASKLVGYGIGQRAGWDNIFVVSRYSPTGNMQGWDKPSTIESYRKNVLPSL